jgi:transcriptional regulator of acetoin/glycerol metabolism
VVPVGEDHPIKVNVRLCAATHRDLAMQVQDGTFREDLFGRVAGFTLALPQLCERRDDFGLILRSLRASIPAACDVRFAPAALRALITHPWPLNIRALEKTLLTAVTLATEGIIEPPHLVDLPHRTPPGDAAERPLLTSRNAGDAALRERLVGLLTVHRGNVVAVSRVIGARRTQIYRWARRLHIDLDVFRN